MDSKTQTHYLKTEHWLGNHCERVYINLYHNNIKIRSIAYLTADVWMRKIDGKDCHTVDAIKAVPLDDWSKVEGANLLSVLLDAIYANRTIDGKTWRERMAGSSVDRYYLWWWLTHNPKRFYAPLWEEPITEADRWITITEKKST